MSGKISKLFRRVAKVFKLSPASIGKLRTRYDGASGDDKEAITTEMRKLLKQAERVKSPLILPSRFRPQSQGLIIRP